MKHIKTFESFNEGIIQKAVDFVKDPSGKKREAKKIADEEAKKIADEEAKKAKKEKEEEYEASKRKISREILDRLQYENEQHPHGG